MTFYYIYKCNKKIEEILSIFALLLFYVCFLYQLMINLIPIFESNHLLCRIISIIQVCSK